MSSVDPVPAPSTGGRRPSAAGAAADDARYLTARRWTVGVLATATVVLVLALVVTVLVEWTIVSAFGVSTAAESAGTALLDLARGVLPGLLVGWCSGLAALAVLVRTEATGPRTTGVIAGVLGTLVGGVLLAAAASW